MTITADVAKRLAPAAVLLLLASPRAASAVEGPATTRRPVAAAAAPAAADLDAAVATLKKLGVEGAGNEAAGAAWKTLAAAAPEQLPVLLAAFKGASPVCQSYLHTAVDAVVESAQAKGAKPSVEMLTTFLGDRRQDGRARRVAYELIQQADAAKAKALLPTLLDDPGEELRRDAVEDLLAQAEAAEKKGDKDGAVRLFEKAFDAGRDQEQVEKAAKKLKEAGKSADLAAHFGTLLTWQVIGPFENTGLSAHKTAYPPEKSVDLKAKMPGKKGEVAWAQVVADDPAGKIDVAKLFNKEKFAAAYAYTTFESKEARDVEIRLGTPVYWQLFVNGESLFVRDEYHSGMFFDQYTVKARLKKGRNTILLKTCQNDQKQEWAQDWCYQLRICDELGTAILSADRK